MLLVRRFDRAKGRPKHQEDGCQILDTYPADKYRVTWNKLCKSVLKIGSGGLSDALRLVQLFLWSYLSGNADLHAKNVSLYEPVPDEGLVMSPAYDLVCTVVYPALTPRMALKLDGKDDRFRHKEVLEHARELGVRERAFLRAESGIVSVLPAFIDGLAALPLPGPDVARAQSLLRDRLANYLEVAASAV